MGAEKVVSGRRPVEGEQAARSVKDPFVSALPKTRNAKVMRRVIRAAYLGEDPGDLSALENPAAVDEIRNA